MSRCAHQQDDKASFVSCLFSLFISVLNLINDLAEIGPIQYILQLSFSKDFPLSIH